MLTYKEFIQIQESRLDEGLAGDIAKTAAKTAVKGAKTVGKGVARGSLALATGAGRLMKYQAQKTGNRIKNNIKRKMDRSIIGKTIRTAKRVKRGYNDFKKIATGTKTYKPTPFKPQSV